MRALVCSVGLVAVLTACGGTVSTAAPAPVTPTPSTSSSSSPAATATSSRPTPSTSPTGPNVSGCFTEQDGKIFKHSGDVPGVITGEGPVGVVISYENQGNVCTWRPLSDRLVAAGYRVLLYTRGPRMLPEDGAIAMGKRLAKEEGVERMFLIGGSIGATVSVPAALRLGKDVAGVVALSGEITPEDAAQLTAPLLQIGSEEDYYGGAEDLTKARDAATKAADNQMMIIPREIAHASALFTGPYGPQVLDRIVAFLDRHKG